MTACTCTEKEYLQFKIVSYILVKSNKAYAVAEYELYSFKKLRISLNR